MVYIQKRAARVTDLLNKAKEMGFSVANNTDWRYAGKLGLKYKKQNPNFIGPVRNKYEHMSNVLGYDRNTFDNLVRNARIDPYREYLLSSKNRYETPIIEKGIRKVPILFPKIPFNDPEMINNKILGINSYGVPSVRGRYGAFDNKIDLSIQKSKNIPLIGNKIDKMSKGMIPVSNIERHLSSNFFPELTQSAKNTFHAHPKRLSYEKPFLPKAYKDFLNLREDANKLVPDDRRRSMYEKVLKHEKHFSGNNLPSVADLNSFSLNPNKMHSIYDADSDKVFAIKSTYDPKKVKVLKADLSNYDTKVSKPLKVESDLILSNLENTQGFKKFLSRPFI